MSGQANSGASESVLGGQAVMEGVMMRSRNAWAVACRTNSGIEVERHELAARLPGLRRLPFVRGVVALGSSIALGVRALHASAQAQLPSERRSRLGPAMAAVTALSLLLGVMLFFVLPAEIASWLHLEHTLAFVLVEKGVRLVLFFLYLALVSRRRYVRRVFEYHGAEHKAIACMEAGDELTPENATRYSRFHPRCGTSFLLLVMVISTLVFACLGHPAGLWLPASRLAGLPVVAALCFEILVLTARHQDSMPGRLISAPGMWLQRLTTREPDTAQLEVAIAALRAAA